MARVILPSLHIFHPKARQSQSSYPFISYRRIFFSRFSTSFQLSDPPRRYTLADKACPYILHGRPSSQVPLHNPLDFELYPALFNANEQAVWVKYLLSILDKAHSIQDHDSHSGPTSMILANGFKAQDSYNFELVDSESDTVLTDYRFHQMNGLDELSDSSIQPLLARLLALRSPNASLYAQILHLGPTGSIGAHLDHPSESGPATLSLSLGGPKIMELLADKMDSIAAYKILLEPGSVYLHRDSVRYRFHHAFPQIDNFGGRYVGGTQRLSLILRDKPVL